MSELIVFKDAEATVSTWLKAVLATHGITSPVGTKMPNPRPARMVRIVRTGGAQRDLVTDRSTMVFECWDATEVAAANLAAMVRAVLAAAAPGWLGAVWSDLIVDLGLVSSPDPDSGSPRYLVTTELHLRGSAL